MLLLSSPSRRGHVSASGEVFKVSRPELGCEKDQFKPRQGIQCFRFGLDRVKEKCSKVQRGFALLQIARAGNAKIRREGGVKNSDGGCNTIACGIQIWTAVSRRVIRNGVSVRSMTGSGDSEGIFRLSKSPHVPSMRAPAPEAASRCTVLDIQSGSLFARGVGV